MNGWLLRYLTKPGAKYYREEALAEYHKYEAVVKAARELVPDPNADHLPRYIASLARALAALDSQESLEELAAEVDEKTRSWPHGFIHPKPGADLGWEIIVGGARKAQEIRDACEKCRAR